MPINETHDPKMKSWVESANDPATDFPIQNLALCAFQASHDGHTHGHLGVAIGDQVLDVSALNEAGLFEHELKGRLKNVLRYPFWDAAVEPEVIQTVRAKVREFLNADGPMGAGGGQQARRLRAKAIRPIADTEFIQPMRALGYTDFYASIHHATTVGSMFRPDNPLLPNYKHIPIGYHGRASSIVVSGADVKRPSGQQSPPDADPKAGPAFGPCKMLDYELEVGFFVGPGNELGSPISIGDAEKHIFGLCLVNDWSARDIQKWEYQPLGPFLAKNFATTVSPFVVSLEALEPFRCPAYKRQEGDPRPLPYLLDENDQARGGIDITLEVWLQSEEMRKRGMSPLMLSRSNAFKDMYWTIAQMLTHHTSNGCNMQPGDLLASGTVSGVGATERGCLLELTWQGSGTDGKALLRKAVQLPTGETRTFLGDGDEVIMKGYCVGEGFRRVGLGECRGRISPAVAG
jgi:fumarylacetoacetase